MTFEPNKQAYWTEHFHRWESSGVNQRDYCRQEGLAFSSFSYWRHRIRATDRSGAAPSTAMSLTWVPTKVDHRDRQDTIHVRSPGGWEITLPTSLGIERMTALLGHVT